MKLHHRFADALPSLTSACQPAAPAAPAWAYFNQDLAQTLGLEQSDALLAILSGQQPAPDSQPVACAYSGHQFGQFNPSLGDGRAHLLGELALGDEWLDVALKGSGRTPYSRGGDGKGTLAAMLREAIISEHLHALGVPSTRSLAVIQTGETVARLGPEPGAVLTRVAASHLRVGSFEYLAARGQTEDLRRLFEFTCQRHYPGVDEPLALLAQVCQRQAELIAQWMSLGFIHGVMNTDNMTLSGESIDFGPCAFMDHYDPSQVFSSIDRQGRYRYEQQPGIGQWNLTRLAESLLPLMPGSIEDNAEQARGVLNEYVEQYQAAFDRRMADKLGVDHADLRNQWLELLAHHSVDWTWGHAMLPDRSEWLALFAGAADAEDWYRRWQALQPDLDRVRANNPWMIARNHRVEAALTAATQGDLEPTLALIRTLQSPFQRAQDWADFGPGDAAFYQSFKTYCGT